MVSDERRSERANVILTATIEAGNARIPVRVGNLSEYGALVIGSNLPANETPIVFQCNGATVNGWVSWSDGTRAGIQFGSPTPPETVTERKAAPCVEIIKDTRELDFRRPGFKGNQMTDEERKIVEEWNRARPKSSEGEHPPES